jgi:hypothetical protein
MVVSRAWEGRERKDGERVVNFQGTFVVPVSLGKGKGKVKMVSLNQQLHREHSTELKNECHLKLYLAH